MAALQLLQDELLMPTARIRRAPGNTFGIGTQQGMEVDAQPMVGAEHARRERALCAVKAVVACARSSA